MALATRSAALLLCLLLKPSLARADGADVPGPESVRISYVAPAECPTREQFMLQVGTRVSIDWLARDDELARHINVIIEPTDAEFTARLYYVDESGKDVERSVRAPNCEQAVAGIALVCAIAVDARVASPDIAASAKPHSTAPKENPPEPILPLPVRENRPLPFSTGLPPEHAEPSRAFAYELGAHVGARSGVGPVMAYGGGIDAGLGQRVYPSWRVAANWYEANEASSVEKLGIASQFRLLTGVLQTCHGRTLNTAPRLVGALCAGVELGQYRARGHTEYPLLFTPHSVYLAWAALELTAPARVSLLGLQLEFAPLIRFPLTHGSFNVNFSGKPSTAYQVPYVAMGLNMGVGLRFGNGPTL